MADITAASQYAFDQLVAYLKADGWGPEVDPEALTCDMAFQGEQGRFACIARIDGTLDHLLFRVTAPVQVPAATRIAGMEFLTRANFGLHIGNFEMDVEDGEVRFKTALDFEGTELTPALFKGLLNPAVAAMDTYLLGLMAVMSGAKSPADAIRDIEA